MKENNNKNKPKALGSRTLKILSIFSIMGILISSLCSLFFALIQNYMNLPDIAKTICVFLSSGIGCFISSMFCSSKMNHKGMVSGLIVGIFMCVLKIIISFFLVPKFSFANINLALILFDIIISIFGGIYGVNNKKLNKRH